MTKGADTLTGGKDAVASKPRASLDVGTDGSGGKDKPTLTATYKPQSVDTLRTGVRITDHMMRTLGPQSTNRLRLVSGGQSGLVPAPIPTGDRVKTGALGFEQAAHNPWVMPSMRPTFTPLPFHSIDSKRSRLLVALQLPHFHTAPILVAMWNVGRGGTVV